MVASLEIKHLLLPVHGDHLAFAKSSNVSPGILAPAVPMSDFMAREWAMRVS